MEGETTLRKIRGGLLCIAISLGLLWAGTAWAGGPPFDPKSARGGIPQCKADLVTCNNDLAACIAEPNAFFLATGQTMAFQANKNDEDGGILDNVDDDGKLQLGTPLQYQDNYDRTVTDLNTGLMWEMKLAADGSDSGNCADGNQDNRDLHCENNVYRWSGDGSQETIWDWLDEVNAENYAGRSDWRTPNIRELHSIVDYGRSNPTANPIFAPISNETWSSTSRSVDATSAFLIDFNDGFSKIPTKTRDAFRVRAVRGGL